MKRTIIVYAVIFSTLILFASCNTSNLSNDGNNANADSAQSTFADEKNYVVVKDDGSNYSYTIFNDNKEAVYRGNLGNKSPTVEFVNENLIDIHYSMGTGLINHKYYSIARDCISREYFYVAAVYDELIAYIYVPDENAFENRRLVIRNIFDSTVYFKETALDFSRVDTPITEAEFINDGAQLKLKYYSGDNKTIKESTIDVN